MNRCPPTPKNPSPSRSPAPTSICAPSRQPSGRLSEATPWKRAPSPASSSYRPPAPSIFPLMADTAGTQPGSTSAASAPVSIMPKPKVPVTTALPTTLANFAMTNPPNYIAAHLACYGIWPVPASLAEPPNGGKLVTSALKLATPRKESRGSSPAPQGAAAPGVASRSVR